MISKDASDRGKATGNNQPMQRKEERVAHHKCQCIGSKAAVAVMVTATAVATTVTTVAAVALKITAATVIGRGTDNNQLKVAAEETAAVHSDGGDRNSNGDGNGNGDSNKNDADANNGASTTAFASAIAAK
jgi:hypothetical protein